MIDLRSVAEELTRLEVYSAWRSMRESGRSEYVETFARNCRDMEHLRSVLQSLMHDRDSRDLFSLADIGRVARGGEQEAYRPIGHTRCPLCSGSGYEPMGWLVEDREDRERGRKWKHTEAISADMAQRATGVEDPVRAMYQHLRDLRAKVAEAQTGQEVYEACRPCRCRSEVPA